MAKTFNEFLVECDNYAYSTESYELMKECSEVALLAQYIKNQTHLMENVSLKETHLEESFFQEKVTKEQLTNLKNKAAEKFSFALKKVKTAANRVLKTLISLLKKFKDFVTKTTPKQREVKECLKANLTQESVNTIIEVYDSVNKTLSSQGHVNILQVIDPKIGKSVKVNYTEGVTKKLDENHLAFLALLTKNDTVNIKIIPSMFNGNLPVSIKIAEKLFTTILLAGKKAKDGGEYAKSESIVHKSKQINKFKATIEADGLNIYTEESKVKKQLDALEEISTEVFLGDAAEAYNDFEDPGVIKEIIETLNSSIAAHMRIYNSLTLIKSDKNMDKIIAVCKKDDNK